MKNAHGEEIPDCNLCGLPCGHPEAHNLLGLIDCEASGAFESTPGNGDGALDDTVAYKFSLCEFCLDWLFSKFKAPPVMRDYMHAEDRVEPFRPAAERVKTDDWRRRKEDFFVEAAKRAAARGL